MANWTKITDTDTVFTCSANIEAKNNVHTWIEYDKDRTTPTQTYIRFRGKPVGKSASTTTYTDAFFALYNANNSPESVGRIFRCIKYYGAKWSDVPEANEVKIEKKYNDTHFKIQDYWICNNGKNAGGYVAADVIKASNASTMYTYFNTGNRKNYKQKVTEAQVLYSLNSSVSVATDFSLKTSLLSNDAKFVLKDNGNNGFYYSVSKDLGVPGTNNPLKTADVYYKRPTDSDWVKGRSFLSETASATIGISIDYSTKTNLSNHYSKSQQYIGFKLKLTGTYGSDIEYTVTTTLPVKQYPCPNEVEGLQLGHSGSRLTKHAGCAPRFHWYNVEAPNSSCRDKMGYKLRLYKKPKDSSSWSRITGLECESIGTESNPRYRLIRNAKPTVKDLLTNHTYEYIHLEQNPPEKTQSDPNPAHYSYSFQFDGTSSIYIDLNMVDDSNAPIFNIGDSFRLGLYSYVKTPYNTFKFSGGNTADEDDGHALSSWFTIQNNGVINVKVAEQDSYPGLTTDSWAPGQVYVKIDDTTWREAEAVYVKTPDGWKETTD